MLSSQGERNPAVSGLIEELAVQPDRAELPAESQRAVISLAESRVAFSSRYMIDA